jgi:L-threonylcarbamoyladenylate synthase
MTSSTQISSAVAALREGRLLAFPTETVYGLGADATNDRAVARIYEAKGRPSFNPLIVHVAKPEAAFGLGVFDPLSLKLAEAFWPGPLTLVVARAKNCPVSLLASAGLDTIALRVPSHPMALALLREFEGPVVAPSANPSGRISPTTAQHVRDGLGDRVDLILDGGPCEVGLESTVVRVMGSEPHLLRAGGVPTDEIARVLGQPLVTPPASTEMHSPGQLVSHYAPRARLTLNAAVPERDGIYLGFGSYDHGPYSLSRKGDLVEAAANLFRMLHELDALSPEYIAVAPIPETGLGEAINDRLRRAATRI